MARYQTVIAVPGLTSPFDRTLNIIRSLAKHGTDRTINNSLTITVSAIRSIPDPAPRRKQVPATHQIPSYHGDRGTERASGDALSGYSGLASRRYNRPPLQPVCSRLGIS